MQGKHHFFIPTQLLVYHHMVAVQVVAPRVRLPVSARAVAAVGGILLV
jgi:hypothetical protein